MNQYVRGVIAGLIATIVLSILMYLKNMMGLMPDVDVIAMLAGKMGGGAMMGWVGHFMIGAIIYGLAFAIIGGKLPGGNNINRGIVLGVIGWLIMMLMLMPMMDGGMFGMKMQSGMMVPVATLMLHIIFGAVLGFAYNKLG